MAMKSFAGALAAAALMGAALTGTALASEDDDPNERAAKSAARATLSPAEIALILSDKGYTDIRKVEFEHGRYKVKARDSKGRRVKLHLDPATGEPIGHEDRD